MVSAQRRRLERLHRGGWLRRRLCGLWQVALLLLCATSLWAAAAEPEAEVEPDASTSSEQATSAGSQGDADEPDFKPSEEISEDFAVSFPVDI